MKRITSYSRFSAAGKQNDLQRSELGNKPNKQVEDL